MSSQKNTINVEEKVYIPERILEKRFTDDGKLQYFLKWKDLPDYKNAWKAVEFLDCPDLVMTYEDSLKCANSEKRKLTDTENIFNASVLKKKACVEESNDTELNINCLPDEIIIHIFRYLKQNELGRIARVSRRWNELMICPVLWKKVNVVFHWCHKSQNKVATLFSENLRNCVTHIKLDFWDYSRWEESLKFEEFCMRLGTKCPSLKALILCHTDFSLNCQSVIDLCSEYMPNLEVLSICYSDFTDYTAKGKLSNYSNIKILDIRCSYDTEGPKRLTFSKMCNLKKLHLSSTQVNDTWFQEDISFLPNLEVLNLERSQNFSLGYRTIQTLQKHALKLTELYLCGTTLEDSDFNFHHSVFPVLSTVCLKVCVNVTCEGIISFIRSCKSLQNVYVDAYEAESYAQHPFVVANTCKLQIVKTSNVWFHYKRDYFL